MPLSAEELQSILGDAAPPPAAPAPQASGLSDDELNAILGGDGAVEPLATPAPKVPPPKGVQLMGGLILTNEGEFVSNEGPGIWDQLTEASRQDMIARGEVPEANPSWRTTLDYTLDNGPLLAKGLWAGLSTPVERTIQLAARAVVPDVESPRGPFDTPDVEPYLQTLGEDKLAAEVAADRLALIGVREDTDFQAYARELLTESQERMRERQADMMENVQGPGDLVLAQAAQSVGQNIPGMVAAGLGGKLAGLATMGYVSYADSYNRALEKGHSEGKAFVYGVLNAAVEAGTESWSLGRLFETAPFRQKFIRYMMRELPQEYAATTLNTLNDMITLGEDRTWQQYLQDMTMTTLVTPLAGAGQVGLVNTVQRAQLTYDYFQGLQENLKNTSADAKYKERWNNLLEQLKTDAMAELERMRAGEVPGPRNSDMILRDLLAQHSEKPIDMIDVEAALGNQEIYIVPPAGPIREVKKLSDLNGVPFEQITMLQAEYSFQGMGKDASENLSWKDRADALEDPELVFHGSDRTDIEDFEHRFIKDIYNAKGADPYGIYTSMPSEVYKISQAYRGNFQVDFLDVSPETLTLARGAQTGGPNKQLARDLQNIGFRAYMLDQKMGPEAVRTAYQDILSERMEAGKVHGATSQEQDIANLRQIGKDLGKIQFKPPAGKLYPVLIPNKQNLLDLDKPLNAQSPKVQAGLQKLLGKKVDVAKDTRLGRELYDELREKEKKSRAKAADPKRAGRATSAKFRAAGIPGAYGIYGKDKNNPRGGREFIAFDPNSTIKLNLDIARAEADNRVRLDLSRAQNIRNIEAEGTTISLRQQIENFRKAAFASKEDLYKLANDNLRFAMRHQLFAGIEQIAAHPQNKDNPVIQQFLHNIHERTAYQGKFATEAADIADRWEDYASDDRVSQAIDAAFVEAERWSRLIRKQRLNREEVAALPGVKAALDAGVLSNEHLALMDQVWGFYDKVFREVLAQAGEHIRWNISDPGKQDELLRALETKVNRDLLGVNYNPKYRYGRYFYEIYDREGNKVAQYNYESKKAREADKERLRKEYGSPAYKEPVAGVDTEALTREKRIQFSGIPDSFIDALNDLLELDEGQTADLEGLAIEQSSMQRMVRRLSRADELPGTSTDALRNFAMFTQSIANKLATLKYDRFLQTGVNDMKLYRQAELASGQLRDNFGDTRDMLAAWMEQERQYLKDPGNEWTEIRGALFHWYLTAVPRAAFANLMQLPAVVTPVLSKEYSIPEAVGAMLRATNEIVQLYKGPPKEKAGAELVKVWSPLRPDQLEALRIGRETVIEESQGMNLGQIEAGNLFQKISRGRIQFSRKNQRRIRRTLDALGSLFHGTEVLNREITFLATYNLEIAKGSDMSEAIAKATAMVRRTNLEYNRYNRPLIMRGKASVLTVFQQYTTQMAFLIGNDPARWRIIGMLLLMGGVAGAPWMLNATDILDRMLTEIGKRAGLKDPKTQLIEDVRTFAESLANDPDTPLRGILSWLGNKTGYESLRMTPEEFGQLVTRGATSRVPNILDITGETADMSGSVGMGRIVPFTEPIGREIESSSMLFEMAKDTAGAGVAVPLSWANLLLNRNTDPVKALESALPTALRGPVRALRYGVTGEETDWKGHAIGKFPMPGSLSELGAVATGFQLSSLSRKREKNFALSDSIRFYENWGGALLKEFYRAAESGDKQRVKEAIAAMMQYNAAVPYPEMGFKSPADIEASYKARKKAEELAELGISTTTDNFRISRERMGDDAPVRDYDR